jgi:transposase
VEIVWVWGEAYISGNTIVRRNAMTDEVKNKLIFFKQVKEFLSSEHYSFYLYLHEYRHSIGMVRDNFSEIEKLIRYSTHNTSEIGLWNFRNRRFMWRSQRQLSRFLSNYPC